MKFPYGISDFKKIVTKGFWYCDRTDRIPLLEKGEYLLFLRPRRFGKSLLVSTLFNYYDVARADEFETLFGSLAIGENPTPLRNRYLVLKWDFSCVDSSGDVREIKRALHDHINSSIDAFALYYKDYLKNPIRIDWDNALNTIHSMTAVVRAAGHAVYLLIDEYDNFANEVMMGVRDDKRKRYEALVYEEGPLRTLFKTVKSFTNESLIDRIFITGVSPVVMSDITSGYNIAENIYLDPAFNDLCGFRASEMESIVRATIEACGLDDGKVLETFEIMRTWYNGYKFSVESDADIYNPTMALYFMKTFYETCAYPRQMLDANLAMDAAKLAFISAIPKGGQLLLNLVREDDRIVIDQPADRFGIREMLSEQSKDYAFMVSFLYYFGVLTIGGLTDVGKIALTIPNLVIRNLYVERIRIMLLPEPADRDEGVRAAEKLYQRGDMEPLAEFVEQRYFRVFHNPDYRWANELTVKTAFLTLLYNDILYVMDSEGEIDRRRADLTMIVRPDMRRFAILDILIEFKFVTLKDAGLTGEQARRLSLPDLLALPAMAEEMDAARRQAREYGRALEKRHGNLRLRKYAVVALGFERIGWTEVDTRP